MKFEINGPGVEVIVVVKKPLGGPHKVLRSELSVCHGAPDVHVLTKEGIESDADVVLPLLRLIYGSVNRRRIQSFHPLSHGLIRAAAPFLIRLASQLSGREPDR